MFLQDFLAPIIRINVINTFPLVEMQSSKALKTLQGLKTKQVGVQGYLIRRHLHARDGRSGLISREGSSELMLCDVQLLAQICCRHLFCLASLKCSRSDTKEDVCYKLLTDRFPKPCGESLGILQLTEVNSRQKHFPLDLTANKMLWHIGWICDSAQSDLSLINVVLHVVKVMSILQNESPFLQKSSRINPLRKNYGTNCKSYW